MSHTPRLMEADHRRVLDNESLPFGEAPNRPLPCLLARGHSGIVPSFIGIGTPVYALTMLAEIKRFLGTYTKKLRHLSPNRRLGGPFQTPPRARARQVVRHHDFTAGTAVYPRDYPESELVRPGAKAKLDLARPGHVLRTAKHLRKPSNRPRRPFPHLKVPHSS